MPHDLRVLDQFAPDDVASIRALADEIEAKIGDEPVRRGHVDRARRSRNARRPRDPAPRARATARSPRTCTSRTTSPTNGRRSSRCAPDADDALGGLLARGDRRRRSRRRGPPHALAPRRSRRDEEPRCGRVRARTGAAARCASRCRSPRARSGPTASRCATSSSGRTKTTWLAVNNRAFAGHPEQGGWALDTLLQREQSAWFEPEGFLLAFDDEGLAGFCWTKVHPADPPKEPDALGEIYVIGADPLRQGIGLGRALTVGGLASLAERGHHHGHALRRRRQRRRGRALPVARLRHPPPRPCVRHGRRADGADRADRP